MDEIEVDGGEPCQSDHIQETPPKNEDFPPQLSEFSLDSQGELDYDELVGSSEGEAVVQVRNQVSGSVRDTLDYLSV